MLVALFYSPLGDKDIGQVGQVRSKNSQFLTKISQVHILTPRAPLPKVVKGAYRDSGILCFDANK